MRKWKEQFDWKKKALAVILLQAVLIAVYSIIVVDRYSAYETIDFEEDDMQLYTVDGDIQEGGG